MGIIMDNLGLKLELKCTQDSFITPYIEGNLGHDKVAAFDKHMSRCEFCRLKYLDKLSNHQFMINSIPNKSLNESELLDLKKEVDEVINLYIPQRNNVAVKKSKLKKILGKIF